MSHLRKYIPDMSHVIQSNDVKMRENLTVEESLVKVVCGGPAEGSVM